MSNIKRRINIGDKVICSVSGVVGTVKKFYYPTASKEQTLVDTVDGREYHAPTDQWKKFSYGTKAKCTEEVLLKIRNEILENMSIPAGLDQVKPINKLVKDMDNGNIDFTHQMLIWPDGNSRRAISDEELEEFENACRINAESFSKSVSWSKMVQQGFKDVGQSSASNIHKISKPEQDIISEEYSMVFDISSGDIPLLTIWSHSKSDEGVKCLNTITGENVKAFYEILTNKNLKGGK